MTKINSRFKSVWDALEDDPEKIADLKMRSQLLIHIAERIKAEKLTQQAAARKLRITQPRVNALLNGKIENFSVGTLITLANRLGLHVSLKIAA
jgi:predicted XRE-type DNA-binding protein